VLIALGSVAIVMEGRIVVTRRGCRDIFFPVGLTAKVVLDALQKRRHISGYLVDCYETELTDRSVLEAGDYTFVPIEGMVAVNS
jgi:hypothetical protein